MGPDTHQQAVLARKLAAKAGGLDEYRKALLLFAIEAEAGRAPDRTWQLEHLGHLIGKARGQVDGA